jgi:phosphoglycolate phosphatase
MNLIFYDLDGTLVDTREDIARSANHMLRQMEVPELSHEEISSYVGHGVFQLISGCLKTEDKKRVEKGIKIYRDYYSKHMLDHSKLFPGVLENLEAFKSCPKIVLTNKPNPYSKDLLKALRIADFFEEIIGGGDPGYPKKPDPSAIFAMQKRFSVLASESLFVGDSEVDIETARNAGIPVVVITHGFSGLEALESAAPDGMTHNFQQLTEWMKQRL